MCASAVNSAVSHGCAEMYRDVELMRAILYAATDAPRQNGAPRGEAAAQARALAARFAGGVADKGLHLFGAEGLRWHRGVHLLIRRIKALQVIFGGRFL
jgi:alkylation response protein AidB-like acyl-CoA dehydrogenase